MDISGERGPLGIAIDDVDGLKDKWDELGLPPHQHVAVYTATLASYAVSQDDPYRATTAIVGQLISDFNNLKDLD